MNVGEVSDPQGRLMTKCAGKPLKILIVCLDFLG